MSFRTASAVRNLLLLLFRRCLLRHALFLSSLLRDRLRGLGFSVRFFSSRRVLLHLHRLLWQLRRSERLSVERDLGDPHRRERLAMSGEFLVLLFLLVVEDQDFLGAVVPEDLPGHQRARLRTHNLSRAGRHRQHVAKLNLAVLVARLSLQAKHVPGRHSVLLSTSADDRVHTPASVVVPGGGTQPRRKETSQILCLLFSPPRLLPAMRTAPEQGRKYRQ